MLDLEAIQRLAKEVVDERGRDFIYNPSKTGVCIYVPVTDLRGPCPRNLADGSEVTGCLIGEILKRAGLLTDYIAGSSSSIRSLAKTQDLPIEPRAVRYLIDLQNSQDHGMAWGEALDQVNTRDYSRADKF